MHRDEPPAREPHAHQRREKYKEEREHVLARDRVPLEVREWSIVHSRRNDGATGWVPYFLTAQRRRIGSVYKDVEATDRRARLLTEVEARPLAEDQVERSRKP